MNWHKSSIDQIFKHFNSTEEGISSDTVPERLQQHGYNQIEESRRKTHLDIFLDQFKDVMIVILMIVAVISGIVGEVTDTLIIILIIFMNAIIGFIQEYKADASIQALKKMSSLHAHVIRDEQLQTIDATELVPGDVIQLQAGSMIPADIRIIKSYGLRVNESALTGESVPVDKTDEVLNEGELSLGDRFNMCYKNTLVIHGRADGIVVGTGMNTEIGKIAGMLKVEKAKTPLQNRMIRFGKTLSFIIVILCALLFVIGILQGGSWQSMLLLSVSLAVAAIPEALPALITVCLSLGARRMVKQEALVRNLPAVETLGAVNFICTDKTGTLTENKMKVVQHVIKDETTTHSSLTPFDLTLALNHDIPIPYTKEAEGDPTEKALLEFLLNNKKELNIADIHQQLPRIHEIPFDSVRKLMTTIHSSDNKFLVLTKGAPEAVAEIIPSANDREWLMQTAEDWSSKGQRVLAFAYKWMDSMSSDDHIEIEMLSAGIVGLIDPPRETVHQSIAQCHKAGIETVMITGDHPATAASIAKQIGILKEGDLVKTNEDLEKMTEQDWDQQVDKIKVYARVSPAQKLQIVHALQKKNYFVAMTGDGVNDAPSLKAANIGVAMGITGSDVSKEAADMILLDDNFNTIVAAVREGRRIYDNIRKFIQYILTCNTAEILIMVLAPLLGLPVPLLPVHILWINLVTDGLPGMALANEKAEHDIMNRPPRQPNENIFSGGLGRHIIIVAIVMTALTLGVQWYSFHSGLEHWQTMVFMNLSIAQLGHIMAIKSNTQSIFGKELFTNTPLLLTVLGTLILQIAIIYIPFMQDWLHTQPLTLNELALCASTALIIIMIVEAEKLLRRKKFYRVKKS